MKKKYFFLAFAICGIVINSWGQSTITFTTNASSSLGTEAIDGEGGSSDIPGITYEITPIGGGDIFNIFDGGAFGTNERGLSPGDNDGLGNTSSTGVEISTSTNSFFAFQGFTLIEIDGNSETIQVTGFSGMTSTGSVTLNANPVPNFPGIDTFNTSDLPNSIFGSVTRVVISVTSGIYSGLFNSFVVMPISNDAPTATAPTTPTVLEDATNVALADNIQVTDSDGDDQTVAFTVTGGIVTLGTAGITFPTGSNGSASFTATGSLANINAALDAATFTPTANLNGTNAGTISFTTNDGVATSTAASVSFNIIAVNDEPSFTLGANPTVNEDAGAQTVNGWATAIDDGDTEATQTLTFTVTNDNNALFSAQPAIDTSGNLTYTPALDANGSATVSVVISDDGGTANGGDDTFATQQFSITVSAVNDEPSFTKGMDEAVSENAGVQTVNNWATALDTGAANEVGQTLSFTVTNSNNALFNVQPAIDVNGNLTYTSALDATGTAIVSVVLMDDGGTANGGDDTFDTQTFNIVVADTTDPTVSITSTESSPTSANPIPITVTFNEDVSGFLETDLMVVGGTISDFTPLSTVEYTFNINHTSVLSNSTITINIAGAVAQDAAGNDNVAASEFTIVALAPALHNETSTDGDLSNDANAPTMLTLASGTNRIIGSVTTSTPADTRDYITFTIPTGMQLSQILLQNYDDPSTTNVNDGNRGFHVLDEGATTFEPGTGDSNDYLGGAHLDPLTPGTDVLSILASAPIAGSGFTAPLQAGTYTYEIQQTGSQISDYTLDFILETETTPPTVEITSTESSPTGVNPIPITITFNESVTGFDINDVTVVNGTPGGFSGSGTTYTVDITPVADGTVTVDVVGNVATDASGNGNTAAPQFSIQYDSTILGIQDELLSQGIKIYPIPSNGILNISADTSLQLKNAQVFDITGKLIYSKDLEASVINSLELLGIRSGIYMVKISSANATATKRLVIQ